MSLRKVWRVPNPPGANPLVAERALGGFRSLVWQGVSSLLEIPTDSCHFLCTPGNPCATPIVTRGEGSFRYQGVSTRGVRHAPEGVAALSLVLFLTSFSHVASVSCYSLEHGGVAPRFSRDRGRVAGQAASHLVACYMGLAVATTLSRLTELTRSSLVRPSRPLLSWTGALARVSCLGREQSKQVAWAQQEGRNGSKRFFESFGDF